MSEGITRRDVLAGLAGATLVGGAALAVGQFRGGDEAPSTYLDFDTERQQGITTPTQGYLTFMVMDVINADPEFLRQLLDDWTVMARQLSAGSFRDREAGLDLPPSDTGEVVGATPSNLTITFGFGRSLFVTPTGGDRFGFAHLLPEGLVDVPKMPRENLDPQTTGGDIAIQICADNPQVTYHAARNLAKRAFGVARVRWVENGFSGHLTPSHTDTARNLFGFKDGSMNPGPSEYQTLAEHVWVPNGTDQAWTVGGTYMGVRKIKMHIETWDRTSMREQQEIFGRERVSGAPLTGGSEKSEVDLAAQSPTGGPVIPMDSHVRLSHHSQFGGKKMLRRPYNYDSGLDRVGRSEAGQLFISFQNSLTETFIPILENLLRNDRLNEYVTHVGSATFAIPPGTGDSSQSIGRFLFA